MYWWKWIRSRGGGVSPNMDKTSQESLKVALGTSHRFWRCQVVLTKICHYYYCHYCYCHCCHYYYCHNLSFWVLPQFNCLSFVTIWAFEFCQFDFLSFVPICFSEFCLNSRFFLVFVTIESLSFFKIIFIYFYFCQNLIFFSFVKGVCLLRETMKFFWMKSRLQNVFGVCLFPNILNFGWQ